ncbi:Ig-like domain-containing protein [Mycolicibacterium diernhoferi]|uniref:Ig-like domain-containing protein n=1 Tax=Mycolicibacterium diernhoferi TaxID=1801 RepID=UPI0021F254BC|nr:hypothetical protein [Mycolicibacterium diernhoferi]
MSFGHGLAYADDGDSSGSSSSGSGSTGSTSDSGSTSESSSESSSQESGEGAADDPDPDPEPADTSSGSVGEGDPSTDVDEAASPTLESGTESKRATSFGDSRKRRSSIAAKQEVTEAPRLSADTRTVTVEADRFDRPTAQRPAPVRPVALSAETTPAAAELTPQAPVVGESVSVVAAEVARVSLLGGLPWGPLVNSPALWVAAAAARRQIGVDSLEDEVAVAENSTPAGLALPTAAVNNRVPTLNKPKVGKPDAATGVVTGVVSGKDADKDPLTFSASVGPVKGSVVVDAATGAFTYTPTAEARHAAAKSGAPASAKSDSFTVSVDDGWRPGS